MRERYLFLFLLKKFISVTNNLLMRAILSLSDKTYEKQKTYLLRSLVSFHEYLFSLSECNPYYQRKVQSERLQRLVSYAYNNISFYRGLFQKYNIDPLNIISQNEFSKIPILRKDDVRRHSESMVGKNTSLHRVIKGHTSGSTGEPIAYLKDRYVFAEGRARLFRIWRWANADPYQWSVLISAPRFRYITPDTTIYINPTRIKEDFEKSMDVIQKIKPSVLRGGPLAVFEFARLIREKNISGISFSVAILYGHSLSESVRSFIEDALRCKVFNLYAMGEIGAIAAECEFHSGFHIFEDSVIVEIIDDKGKLVKSGTRGKIIITDLNNYVMPFIRYDTGDMGMLLSHQCDCGRVMPLLDVDGREEDMMILPNDKLVFGGNTRDCLDRYSTFVKRYQLIQKDLNKFLIRIVRYPAYTITAEKMIIMDLKKLLGDSINLSVEYCDNIPLEPSGKFKQLASSIWEKRLKVSLARNMSKSFQKYD